MKRAWFIVAHAWLIQVITKFMRAYIYVDKCPGTAHIIAGTTSAPGAAFGHPYQTVKVACEEEEFLELLLVFAHTAWDERHVPQEWADKTLIAITKKGNLSDYNNWRGIALLEVVEKVVHGQSHTGEVVTAG